MTDLDRFQTFMIDCEALIGHRDNYYRQIREMTVEMELLEKHSLPAPGFAEQKQQYMEQNRLAMAQTDELMRGSERMLLLLTGKNSMADVRSLMTQIKAALREIIELKVVIARATAIKEIAADSEEELVQAAEKDLAVSERQMERAMAYVAGLVPANYSPNASTNNIRIVT